MSTVRIYEVEKKVAIQKKGFTILEVLISFSILALTLMALYQSFSTSIFILSSTNNLWKAISFAQNELLKSERATVSPSVSINQGEFESESGMSGFRWKRFVRDTKPFPGIEIRQINYQLLWNEGKHVYTYDAYIYVKPNNARHLNSGFSILELLLSVTLLGLVMSVLYAAFFQISNSSLKVQSTLDTRQELRLLMKIVLDDLQNVRYLKHFAELDQSESQQRETGLIAARNLGPEKPRYRAN